jgi:aryl-alcohol dehydrogenase-like predicted oxidoreductase
VLSCVKPSKLVLGAKANNYQLKEHTQIIESALEQSVWLHTSLYYSGSLDLIGRLAKEKKKNLRCIAKVSVDSRDRGTLKNQVEETLEKSGLEHIDIIQICGNPAVEEMMPGRFFRTQMDDLVRDGKVGEYYPELYWQYSDNYEKALKDGLFNGCIFYHNLFLREMKSSLYETISSKGSRFNGIALRALGGGPGNYYEDKVSESFRSQVLKIVKDSGLDELEFRMAYLMAKSFMSSLVVGTSRLKNFNNVAEMIYNGKCLDAELVEKIDAIHYLIWAKRGIGNGEGLHRPYGRLGIKIIATNTKKTISRVLKNKPKGYDW